MKFQQILTLARVPNVPTVWSNGLMTWVLAGGQAAYWPALLAALAGGTLVYAGGCTLNDAFDARWDRLHKPDRLIPSGTLTERAVWTLGIGEMLAGLTALALAGPGTVVLPVLLTAAVVFYDYRHKRNPWSVVIMGACRALLVLSVAGVAVGSIAFGPQVWTAAVVVWVY
ncbi:MAG: prenyltransferase, partial [Verrucomicrobiaceae bacterium]